MNEERTPVTTVEELARLDSAEIVEGYNDGYSGEPEPGGNRSKAYWHGFRNGVTDRTGEASDEQHLLAREVIRTGFFRGVRA